jgi:uncharacterized protein YehS (DUF1456 family)
MIALFDLAGLTVSREQISNWLKKDDDAQFVNCNDNQLATFLNGFIVEKRGKREGEQPVAEKRINNNIVLNKLKIALALRAEDVIDMMATNGFNMTKPELSAFFRKPEHKHYRECKDQFLRNFIQAIDKKFSVARPEKFRPNKVESTPTDQDECENRIANKSYSAAKPKASKIYVNPNKKTVEKEAPKRKILKLKPSDIWGKE